MVAALLLGAAGAPDAGLPGIGGADPRVRVAATVPPWSALARLQIPGAARCTAFLVAPRTALTAAHCLYVRRAGHFAPAGSVHLLAGYAAGGFSGHAVAVAYRLAPGFDPRAPPAAFGADIAVLTLDRPLAAPDRVLGLADAVAGPVALGGYSQDRAEVIEADLGCRLLGRAADAGGRALLRHGCTGTRGTSGAPLLARAAGGGWQVVGLQVAAARDGAGGLAVPAARLRALLAGE